MNRTYLDFGKKMIRNVIKRNITKSTNLNTPKTYEGDGKTTLHILNKEDEFGLMINGYSQMGFRLNNNVTVLGPMIIFHRSVLAWQINEFSQIDEESLSLFAILEPKLDILVVGAGDTLKNLDFFHKLIPFSKKFKIPFEILPTEQACATFNFLNTEGRNVAGAMIPPTEFQYSDDDELKTKLRYQNLYEKD